MSWEASQLQAAQQYAAQLAELFEAEPQLLEEVVDAFLAAGLRTQRLTVEDVQTTQDDIEANGLPEPLVSILEQLGASSEDINQIQEDLLALDPNVVAALGGGRFPQMLVDQAVIDAIHRVADVLKQFAGANAEDGAVERSCPLDAQEGRIIVEFPEDVVLTTRKQAENSFGPLKVDIPAGTYHITLVSFDDHIEHPEEEEQTQESWFLQAENEEEDIFFESNAISDLPKAQNILEEHVEEHVEITQGITGLSAKHILGVGESDTAESIWPVCAAFDEVEENNQD